MSRINVHIDNDLLIYFAQEVALIPRLSREEEVILIKDAKAGNIDARNRLAEANLWHVLKIARRYRSSHLSAMELISEGYSGLLYAIDRFDADRGFRLITYAESWIRQKIRVALVNAEKNALLSLDDPLKEGDEGRSTFIEFLVDERQEEKKHHHEKRNIVNILLGDVKNRDREVIELHYLKDLTFDQIGAIFGISRTRVIQIERRVLREMRWSARELGILEDGRGSDCLEMIADR